LHVSNLWFGVTIGQLDTGPSRPTISWLRKARAKAQEGIEVKKNAEKSGVIFPILRHFYGYEGYRLIDRIEIEYLHNFLSLGYARFSAKTPRRRADLVLLQVRQ
jgi:hypothetical protein